MLGRGFASRIEQHGAENASQSRVIRAVLEDSEAMTQNRNKLPRERFARLQLAKDLAVRGVGLFAETSPDADAIQAIVLLDLGVEISMATALDAKGIQRSGDRFFDLLSDLPEMQPLKGQLEDLHRVRNRAQHSGIAPPGASRPGLRSAAVAGLRVAFAAAGSDYDRLSSVEQIKTKMFLEPLRRATSVIDSSPTDAAALSSLALRRVRGWAAQITGEAVLPSEMWVFGNALWEDLRVAVSCLDNRQEFIEALLKVAGGQALGLGMATQLRLEMLGRGHSLSNRTEGPEFVHAADAQPVTVADAEWMIEAVARVAVKLEDEWPEFLVVDDEASSAGTGAAP